MGGRSQTRSSQRLNSKTVPDPQRRDESAEKGIWPETARGKQATPSPTLGTRGTRGCRNTEGPRPEAAGRSCSREADPALRPPAHVPGRLTQCPQCRSHFATVKRNRRNVRGPHTWRLAMPEQRGGPGLWTSGQLPLQRPLILQLGAGPRAWAGL